MANKDVSKFYKDFRVRQPENKTPKNIWLKVWKWIKIVIVILFLAIGLVGCVQSFTVKSSNKVGSGQELYSKKSDISPNIVTYRYDSTGNFFTLPNKINDKNIIANTYLALKEPNAINELRKRDPNYGAYGSRSFGLQLQMPKNDKAKVLSSHDEDWTNITEKGTSDKSGYIYNVNGNYAYFNLGDEKGNYKTKNYTPLTKFSEILIPNSLSFDTKPKDKDGIIPTDWTKIKEFNYDIVEGKLTGGSSVDEIVLRDIFQILVSNTLQKWASLKTFKDDKVNIFKEALKLNGSENANQIIEKWNQFIKSYEQKAKNKTLLVNEDEGRMLLQLFTFVKSVFQQYLSNVNYVKLPSKTNDGSFVYRKSSLSPASNYNSEYWTNTIFNNSAILSQKPISTYKEYWAQGPFYGIFVQPIYLFMDSIIKGLGTTGWSIILALVVVIIIVRLVVFGVSFKSLFSQAKMEEFNQKKAKIESKYAAYKGDRQMMQRKQAEISELYKKEKISPWSQIWPQFIALPILIVVFRVINTSPEIKQATWYSIQLSANSLNRVFSNKEFIYLPIILISVGMQALSQYMPKILNWKKKKSLRVDAYQKAAMKKQNRMSNIISLVFIIFGAFFSAGLQIYWIVGAFILILQHIFVHYFQRTKFFKQKVEPKLTAKAA